MLVVPRINIILASDATPAGSCARGTGDAKILKFQQSFGAHCEVKKAAS